MDAVRHELFHCMGIPVHLTLIGATEPQTKEDADRVEEVFRERDRVFSRFRHDSELVSFNSRSGQWCQVSRELFSVIEKCVNLSKATDGIFDASAGGLLAAAGYGLPTGFRSPEPVPDFRSIELDHTTRSIRCLPGQILEPAAIVKGMAIDDGGRAILHSAAWMINAGGDILTKGPYPGQAMWHIALQHPSNRKAAATFVGIRNEAIATSGTYEVTWSHNGVAWHHQVNMRTRRPTTGLKSVSVIAKNAERADTLASIGFLSGLENGRRYLEGQSVPYLFIDDKDRMVFNALFSDRQMYRRPCAIQDRYWRNRKSVL